MREVGRSFLRSGVLLLLVALVLTVYAQGGQGAAPSGPQPRYGGTIRAALEADVVSLDPLSTLAGRDLFVLLSIYNSLVAFDEDLNIVPSLATSWETPNNTTLIFHLREGVRFHDGTSFDAPVAKWNLDRARDASSGSLYANNLAAVSSVEVVGKFTIKLNLKQPYAPLLSVLPYNTGMMVSPRAFEARGKDFGRSPVGGGTGPFRFVHWRPDDEIRIERFSDYWERGLPYLDAVVYRPMPDSAARLANIRAGEINYLDRADGADVPVIRADSRLRITAWPGLLYNYIVFNLNKKPFNNPLVRRALAHATSREAYLTTIINGQGSLAEFAFPPGNLGYDPNFKWPYKFDPALARQLMREAGYPDGFETSIIVLPITEQIRTGELTQALWGALGIKVTVKPAEIGAFLRAIADGDYDTFTGNFGTGVDPDLMLSSMFHPSGAAWKLTYNNPRVTQLIETARATFDLKQRKAYYRELAELVARDVPQIVLYHQDNRHVYRANVRGVAPRGDRFRPFTRIWLDVP